MKNEILKVLYDLLKIESVSTNINKLEKIIDYVEKYFFWYEHIVMKKLVYNEKPTIIIQNFEWKEADIILSWHLDVVPPSEENQFDPIIKDWKIYARWAWDMKSWDAIMIVLMKKILEEKFTKKKVILMLTTDEELWWFDWVKNLVEDWYIGKIVLIPDSWKLDEIVIWEKWIVSFTLTTKWKSAHSSRPWLWDNAITKVINIYNELKEFIQDDKELFETDEHWWCSTNLNTIKSWTANNVIPDTAEAWFDIRITQKFSDIDKLIWKIEKIVSKNDWDINSLLVWDLLFTDENNEYVKKYINSYKNIFWELPKLSREHWASDWRFFANKWIPVILHRPTCSNIHSKWEYVEEEAIYKVYDIYHDFIFNS